MRQKFMVVVLFAISLGAVAQENALKPRLSDAPLTSEQIAVYRATLSDYLKGSNRVLNLANLTEPLDVAAVACWRSLDAEVAKKPAAVIHRIEPSLVAGTKIVLVDPDRQYEMIKENDPQNLMRKAVDEGQKITDEQLNQSIKSAFNSGLYTLSEIFFDKEHRHAAVSYSFVCGGLCGNGNTLILKKAGNIWRVVKRCGGWVS